MEMSNAKGSADWFAITVVAVAFILIFVMVTVMRAWVMGWDWSCAVQTDCHAVHVQ